METAAVESVGNAFAAYVVARGERALRPVVRPIEQWVTEEVVCPPTSPFAGQLYRHEFHPCSRNWFRLLGERLWKRTAVTAPSQCGKTFMGYVAPVLWHLFERKVDVIVGVPNMDMANDKWGKDFSKVILASWPEFLPTRGEGCRGGKIKSGVQLRHGPELRFMAGGGDDKQRAGATTAVLAITETNGFDSPGKESAEGGKIDQLEARLQAQIESGEWWEYTECTNTTPSGFIWHELTEGTNTLQLYDCPLCGVAIHPERDDLQGWQEGNNKIEAGRLAHFVCPKCQGKIDEQARRQSWLASYVVHEGQTVENGTVVGDPKETDTLGFRWTAWDNPFVTINWLGQQEWKTRRSPMQDAAERVACQFRWGIPHEPPDVELIQLDADDVAKRTAGLRKREVPDDAIGIGIQIDIHNRHLNWVAMAVTPTRFHVIEYGDKETNWKTLEATDAIVAALKELKAYFDAGWATREGKRFVPDQVWMDSGHGPHQKAVYPFCRWANAGIAAGCEVYRPTKGYGEMQRRMTTYRAPEKITNKVRYIGNEFHLSWMAADTIMLVEVNSDAWKATFQGGLAMQRDDAGNLAPGAVTLYVPATKEEHYRFSMQTTAQHQVEDRHPERGPVIVYRLIEGRSEDHYLDAGYGATCACWFIRTETEKWQATEQRPQTKPEAAFTAADGRPFLLTER